MKPVMLCVFSTWILSLTAAAADRPNVIVIYTDDQGFGDTSYLNPDAKFQTPNLDRIASEGIAFTNAHSADSVCTPSRYGLLTGRYCWRTTRKKGVLGAEAPCLIPDDRLTLASLLQQNGYRTAMFGKWHLGMDFPGEPGQRDWTKPVQDMPLDKGFDHFFGVPASLNFGVLAWFENRFPQTPPTLYTAKKPNPRYLDYRIQPPYQTTPEATQQALGKPGMEVAPDFVDNLCLTRFTNEALTWIKTHQQDAKSDKPFFVYLAMTSPHYPVCPLPQFHGQGACGAYGEFVIETDHHVGRLLQYLDEAGLADNTLVIYTSDNGPENSWRSRIEDFQHDSRGRFRGGKRDIYEGGHRLPFFVRWPKRIAKPGRTYDGLVGQVDVLATLAELIEAELPSEVAEDSQSFLSVLLNAQAQPQRAPLINHAANGRFAVTDGHWKLVMPHRDQTDELYNLADDETESQNLASQHPDKVKELTEAISRIICNGRSTPGPRVDNDTGYWQDLAWLTKDEYERRSTNR